MLRAPTPLPTTRPGSLRNFGIIAHIDSGKTTLSERLLYLAGEIHAIGDIDDGTTTLDHEPLSREKGITIQAAVTSLAWRDHHLNLIDTPGHVDFTAEVERSCRVLDGAVAVFCAVGGVQAQSETVWRQAARYRVPCLVFINKIDRAGADVERVIGQLRTRLGAHPVLLTYPVHDGDTIVGVADVITGDLHTFGGADQRTWTRAELPAHARARWTERHRALVEAVAATDDALLARWDAHGDLTPDELRAGLRAAVRTRELHPVLCGAALATLGVQPLLDAIVDLLPSPDLGGRPDGLRPAGSEGGIPVPPAADRRPLRALVFKVVATAHGELGFCRVYQGTLRAGDHLWCPNRARAERVARLVKLHGAHHVTVPSVGAGDLCAVVGIRHAASGDTLCPADDVGVLPGIAFAEPVLGMAVEGVTARDQQALGQALARLAREDPTFRRHVDPDTGQLVLHGMGELHLEVLAHRLEHQHHVKVRLGEPRVTLRQRITRTVRVRGFHRVQNGGPGAHGDVTLVLRAQTPDESAAGDDVVFATAIKGGAVDRQYFSAIEDGVRAELARGGKAGVRIVGVHATLVDGSMHVQDSNERAFEAAGALAVRAALGDLGLELLEPWMRLDIGTPAAHVGAVIGALTARRGRVTDLLGGDGGAAGAAQPASGDGQTTIRAEAPLAALAGFPVLLRSLTQGRGSALMEPGPWRPVPAHAENPAHAGAPA